MKTADSEVVAAISFAVDGEGPPIILLHGMSGSRRWWSHNVPALAGRFRTYAVDLPGFGQSRDVRWERIEHTVQLLLAWMESQGITRSHVIGHSLGGAIAARIAARSPHRVDRLVLVDAAIRPPQTRVSIPAASFRHTVVGRPRGLAHLVARDFLRTHPWSIVSSGIDLLGTNWASDLCRITRPTLIVWGEHDLITPVSFGRRLAAVLPNAHLIVIPKAGHSPMWEQPHRFNQVVLEFLGAGDTGQEPRRPDEGGTSAFLPNTTPDEIPRVRSE